MILKDRIKNYPTKESLYSPWLSQRTIQHIYAWYIMWPKVDVMGLTLLRLQIRASLLEPMIFLVLFYSFAVLLCILSS